VIMVILWPLSQHPLRNLSVIDALICVILYVMIIIIARCSFPQFYQLNPLWFLKSIRGFPLHWPWRPRVSYVHTSQSHPACPKGQVFLCFLPPVSVQFFHCLRISWRSPLSYAVHRIKEIKWNVFSRRYTVHSCRQADDWLRPSARMRA
jgi:hypothetical protein